MTNHTVQENALENISKEQGSVKSQLGCVVQLVKLTTSTLLLLQKIQDFALGFVQTDILQNVQKKIA